MRPDLAGGAAGLAVVHAHLGGDAARADRCLDAAVEALATQRLPPGLYDGVAGVGWAVARVATLRGEGPGDALEEVDAALLAWAERAPARFDLTSGLAGVGVYALERLPGGAALLAAVVEALAARAQERREGACWHTPAELMSPGLRRDFPAGRHDLGMAHGTPGVVALLAAACAAGVAVETARPLAAAGAAWVVARAAPEDPSVALPYWLADGHAPEPARVAWCYGDLGAAAALAGVDREAALLLARRAAARRGTASGVTEASLCHGAAGAAHLFARLAAATGDEVLADAARRWTRCARRLPPPDEPGLLTGAAGVALSLDACRPGWDRFLLPAA